MNYRADINALRAISVILVVLFHFQIGPFTSGFIGVDIFFVISGFLMTKIITNKIKNRQFSLIEFYASRAKRLIPALAALCATLIVFGWFFLAPEDYRKLAEHVASSINFTSNLTYAKEVDYFDADSSEKWMLHTWSLSVEWQFYMLFPLIILLLSKLPISIHLILYALLTSSLCMALYFYITDIETSYYYLSSRAWEMLAGGLVAITNPKKHIFTKIRLETISIVAITAFACLPKTESTWPSPATIFPIFFTCIILLRNKQHHIYNNIAIKEVGASSYSIYIWHWPIYVLINHLNLQGNNLALVTGLIFSLVAGIISKKIIEEKFTHKKDNQTKSIIKYILLIAIIYAAGMHIVTSKGYPQRMEKSLEKLGIDLSQLDMPSRKNGFCFKNFNADKKSVPSEKETECWIGDSNAKETVLLFGDSFAGQWEPFWDDFGKHEGLKIRSVTTNWCYPSLNTNYTGPYTHPGYNQCLINRKYLKANAEKFDTIILAAHWLQVFEKGDLNSLSDVIETLKSKKLKVIIMPSPTIFDQNILSKFKFYNFNNLDFDIEKSHKEKDKVAEAINNNIEKEISGYGEFIKRENLFNFSQVTNQGIPYSLDGRHISIYGAHAAYDRFLNSDQYKNILGYIKNAP